MSCPTRKEIALALKARLARITVVNGYATGAGANAHLGRIIFTPENDPFPLVAVAGVSGEMLEQGLSPTVTYDDDSSFVLVGAITNDADGESGFDLLDDMQAAAVDAPDTPDAIDGCRVEIKNYEFIYPASGEPYVTVHQYVAVRRPTDLEQD